MPDVSADDIAPQPTQRRQTFRADIIIAVSALFISTLATAASFWQGRVVSDQLSASVYPFLTFTQQSGDDHYSESVTNDGMGPAVIYNAALIVDGRRFHQTANMLDEMLGPAKLAGSLSLGSLRHGSVVRPGVERVIFQTRSDPHASAAAALFRRTTLEVCYCSVLGRCWQTRSTGHALPSAVRSCVFGDAIEPGFFNAGRVQSARKR